MTTQQNFNKDEEENLRSGAAYDPMMDPSFGISIMTDPDLHPLPITPNDPLSIFLTNQASSQQQRRSSAKKQSPLASPMIRGFDDSIHDPNFDMEISNTDANPNSLFQPALPSLKLNTEGELSGHQLD